MPVIRPKRYGSYVPLLARFYEDAAVMKLSQTAENLFVRSLSWCASSMTDGYFSQDQVRLYARPSRYLSTGCAELVEAQLWTVDTVRGGWYVTNWLKYNPSAEDITAGRERDRTRKREKLSARKADGIPPESDWTPSGILRTTTDTTTTTESSNRTPAGSVRLEATGGRPRQARDAGRPPDDQKRAASMSSSTGPSDWRAEMDRQRQIAVPPPDHSELRRQLAEASSKIKSRKPGPWADLSKVVRAAEDDSGEE